MSKTSYTVNEVLKEIASTIKAEIAAHEASIEAMRKKELERSHGKLNKSESLCPLCAEVDVNGRCGCLAKSENKKAEMSDKYSRKTGISTNKGTRGASSDFDLDNPLPMSHPSHGKAVADLPTIKGNKNVKKDEMDGGGDSSMMMSELCLKCGKKNSLCKCMAKNDFITGAKHTQGYNAKVSFGPKATHSSGTDSMMATSPKDEPAAYGGSVKGSPAHNAMQHLPTKPAPKPINITKGEEHLDKAAMASSSASALAPKPEVSTPAAHVNKELGGFKSLASKPSISSMGRAKASVSGSFNTIKSELKATKAPAFKPNPGSGGETKKGPSLKKSTIPSVKQPAVVGTAGKQPVGLGGGDANKIPGGAPATPNVQGSSPAGQWKGQGLPQLQQKLAAVRGGVSWLKSTHSKASRVHPAQAAPKSQRFHGALPLQRGEKEPTKKTEMPAPTEGLSSINHNRRMLKVKA